jgi:hypothetical protein
MSDIAIFNNSHESPPDPAELQPFARLTNQGEANKIRFAMQAGVTGINAVNNMRGYYGGAPVNGKMIFDGETVFGACSETVFEVKKEIPDGLSVLFYTGDIEPF